MELKPNMYVRTNEGYICKILKLNEPFEDDGYLDHNDIGSSSIQEKNLIKASYNIIDLIETGDYVKYNNQTSFYKVCDFLNEKVIVYGKSFGDWVYINSDDVDIKSIVTKEQFESMIYKVEQ